VCAQEAGKKILSGPPQKKNLREERKASSAHTRVKEKASSQNLVWKKVRAPPSKKCQQKKKKEGVLRRPKGRTRFSHLRKGVDERGFLEGKSAHRKKRGRSLPPARLGLGGKKKGSNPAFVTSPKRMDKKGKWGRRLSGRRAQKKKKDYISVSIVKSLDIEDIAPQKENETLPKGGGKFPDGSRVL